MKVSLIPTLRFLLGFACLVVVLAGLQRVAPMFNRLAEALTIAVSDTQMRHRAAELGEKIRAESGVREAVEAIQRFVQ